MIALSYTSLSSYRSCPLFFRFKYVERRKPTLPQNNRWFIEGAVVHECLEAGFNHSKPMDVEFVDSIFDATFARVFTEQRSRGVIIFMNGETVDTIKVKTKELLHISIATVKKLGMDVGDFYSEYSIGTYREPFELVNGLWIQGAVDWAKNVGSYMTVGDFKTSKDMAYVKAMQLLIYVLALEKKLGRKVIDAFYLMLRSGAKVPVRLTQDQRDEALRILVESDKGIKEGRFEATPSDKVCHECVFRNTCPSSGVKYGPKTTSFGSSSSC